MPQLYGAHSGELAPEVETSLRRITQQLGLADDVVDAAIMQAKVNVFTSAVISGSAGSPIRRWSRDTRAR